jgi:hypothetical protein
MIAYHHSVAKSLLCLLCFFASGGGLSADSPVGIRVLPESIELTNQGATQRLLAQAINVDGSLGKTIPTEEIHWTVEDPSIAILESMDGLKVKALRDGSTKLLAKVLSKKGQPPLTATINLTCRQTDVPRTIEFNNHVEAVLARRGCNMGACHGALAGKGGFRLSLRGYDSATDFFNMTRQDRGRRIDLDKPGASLILAKPSGAIEHKGGMRLPVDSPDYRLVAEWIATGARGPRPEDPVIRSIEVFPTSIRLSTGDQQPLLVRALYSNGRTEDVTSWAKYSATDEAVATVDEHGMVKVVGPGEGAVTVWFASQIVSARVSVPFSQKTSSPNSLTASGFIDTSVLKQMESLRLEVSPLCNDSEFIRRSTLDATGILPTEEQVRGFLADSQPDKRSRWIDNLLASPAYVDYWSYRWSDVLMLNSNLLRSDSIKAYYTWIREHVEKNTPWDQFTREIVTARGEALENGATNFYAINQDPETMTENVCQAFMGLSIGCAKCHNHPLEKWTNDQYYAMANMFARVRAKGWSGEVRDGDSTRTVMVADRGNLIQPLRGRPQPPTPLDGEPLDMEDPSDRRIVLADWLTSPNNPYFTRAIVNRVWAAYFGVGIVNPVDDLRASNPASNPQLMDSLCIYLVECKYDLKQLMRAIMNSETYQRSSITTPLNQDDRKYFSHYYPRRLMAEVIHDAIVDVTTVPTVFDKVAFLGGDKRPTKFYAKGTKALQLFDASVDNNFLRTFGRNQRRITCECERSDEPSVIQVLNLNNGDTLNTKLAEKGSIVDVLLDKYAEAPEAMMDTAYLRCLARYPTPKEKETLLSEIRQASDEERRVVLEDLLWSLITSREFLFNH